MDYILKLDNQVIYTLKDINELYKTYNNINKYYHFTYKTEKSAVNFGNFELSLIDKQCHHFILDNITSFLLNSNSLILTSNNFKNKYRHTIANDCIAKNYQFNGHTLIIYNKTYIKNKE